MLSKNKIKLIKSLAQKKFRVKENLFIVEGVKGVKEFLDSNYELDSLYFCNENEFEISQNQFKISKTDLQKITHLKNANSVLAIFKIPRNNEFSYKENLVLALDDLQDPGNLGTIIRLCDWFGISNIVCSENTVDCFNPKVVQSTMGSLTRVNISYLNLKTYLEKTDMPIYGTFLGGDNIYSTELVNKGVIVMGNEGNGISCEIEKIVTQKLTIPRFGNLEQTESLNVATATSIVLSEFKRRTF